MKKKIASMLLLTVLISVCMTACGNNDTQKQTNTNYENFEQSSQDDINYAIGEAEEKEHNDKSDEVQQIILNAEQSGTLDGSEISWYYANNTLLIKGNGDMPSNSNRADKGGVSTVIINEKGDAYLPELDNHGYWDSHTYSAIKTVIIDDGVTSIGSYAFYECLNLTTVYIPDSIAQIGNYAFYGCPNLKEISLPNSVVYIGSYAFYDSGCYENIQVSDNVYIGEKALYTRQGESDIVFEEGITSVLYH